MINRQSRFDRLPWCHKDGEDIVRQLSDYLALRVLNQLGGYALHTPNLAEMRENPVPPHRGGISAHVESQDGPVRFECAPDAALDPASIFRVAIG